MVDLRRVLWPIEPLVCISDRKPSLSWDYGTLLDGQLPTLTARSVGTVIHTTTTDEKLRIGGNMDVRFVGTLCDILKGRWTKGPMSIDAL